MASQPGSTIEMKSHELLKHFLFQEFKFAFFNTWDVRSLEIGCIRERNAGALEKRPEFVNAADRSASAQEHLNSAVAVEMLL